MSASSNSVILSGGNPNIITGQQIPTSEMPNLASLYLIGGAIGASHLLSKICITENRTPQKIQTGSDVTTGEVGSNTTKKNLEDDRTRATSEILSFPLLIRNSIASGFKIYSRDPEKKRPIIQFLDRGPARSPDIPANEGGDGQETISSKRSEERPLSKAQTAKREALESIQTQTVETALPPNYFSKESELLGLQQQGRYFPDYLHPNEFPRPRTSDGRSPSYSDCPNNGIPDTPEATWSYDWYNHGPGILLKDMEEGWIVSTGTERTLFNAALAPKQQCHGIIIRDVNPNVFDYMNTLLCLIRISKNRNDFNHLLELMSRDSDMFFCDLYRRILIDTQMPKEIKQFYVETLKQETNIYMLMHLKGTNPLFSTETQKFLAFKEVNYTQDDALFNRIQELVRKGRIIPTVGSIDDLACFQPYNIPITFIDISNIPFYTELLFNISDHPHLRIMETIGTGTPGSISSVVHGYSGTKYKLIVAPQLTSPAYVVRDPSHIRVLYKPRERND
jgi:hypothetical protein